MCLLSRRTNLKLQSFFIACLALSFCILGCETASPIQAGKVELEGSGAVHKVENDLDVTRDYEIDGTLLYAFVPWLEGGALLVFEQEKTTSQIDGLQNDVKNRSFLFGPVLRLNMPLNEKVVPFLELGGGVDAFSRETESTNMQNEAVERKLTDTAFFWQTGLGCRFFMTESAALTLKAFYRDVDTDKEVFGGDTEDYGLLGGVTILF